MKALTRLVIGAGLALATTVAAADGDRGREVFERSCEACHGGWGGYGAPGIGNYDAWRPALRRGEKGMMASVIEGRNSMPPRGGNPTLSDEDLSAAVQWIVKFIEGDDSVIAASKER